MFSLLLLLLSVQNLSAFDAENDVNGFDDSILYNLQWSAKDMENLDEESTITISTSYNEKYTCSMQNLRKKVQAEVTQYAGPTPLELLSPLFSQSSCSYRLESYWSYEICHGRHVRQYHEEREGKKVKLQEYILGQWDDNTYTALLNKMKVAEKLNKNETIPVRKIDGMDLPYFEIEMGNGTTCELNQNQPRKTKLVYVCYIHGKHEIFTFKEIATCVYEAVILSPILCSHPKYKPQELGENGINCIPLDDSPKKPRKLIKMENEAAKLRRRPLDLDHPFRVEFHQLGVGDKTEQSKVPEPIVDTSPVESFLAGKNCLSGGKGWWKYEFCYGKYVHQFHVENGKRSTTINLGKFNKQKHLEWIAAHPQKRPKPMDIKKQFTHFYADGDVCDPTGKPRQTEVKLKCSNDQNRNSVSLYLLEPKYCEYILGVESPLICDILKLVDENGLVPESDPKSTEDEITMVKIVKV